jgi:hypothetical protein
MKVFEYSLPCLTIYWIKPVTNKQRGHHENLTCHYRCHIAARRR